MSGKERAIWAGLMLGLFLHSLLSNWHQDDMWHDHEARITELEQSQCITKEAKDHADVKFAACIKQLGKR